MTKKIIEKVRNDLIPETTREKSRESAKSPKSCKSKRRIVVGRHYVVERRERSYDSLASGRCIDFLDLKAEKIKRQLAQLRQRYLKKKKKRRHQKIKSRDRPKNGKRERSKKTQKSGKSQRSTKSRKSARHENLQSGFSSGSCSVSRSVSAKSSSAHQVSMGKRRNLEAWRLVKIIQLLGKLDKRHLETQIGNPNSLLHRELVDGVMRLKGTLFSFRDFLKSATNSNDLLHQLRPDLLRERNQILQRLAVFEEATQKKQIWAAKELLTQKGKISGNQPDTFENTAGARYKNLRIQAGMGVERPCGGNVISPELVGLFALKEPGCRSLSPLSGHNLKAARKIGERSAPATFKLLGQNYKEQVKLKGVNSELGFPVMVGRQGFDKHIASKGTGCDYLPRNLSQALHHVQTTGSPHFARGPRTPGVSQLQSQNQTQLDPTLIDTLSKTIDPRASPVAAKREMKIRCKLPERQVEAMIERGGIGVDWGGLVFQNSPNSPNYMSLSGLQKDRIGMSQPSGKSKSLKSRSREAGGKPGQVWEEVMLRGVGGKIKKLNILRKERGNNYSININNNNFNNNINNINLVEPSANPRSNYQSVPTGLGTALSKGKKNFLGKNIARAGHNQKKKAKMKKSRVGNKGNSIGSNGARKNLSVKAGRSIRRGKKNLNMSRCGKIRLDLRGKVKGFSSSFRANSSRLKPGVAKSQSQKPLQKSNHQVPLAKSKTSKRQKNIQRPDKSKFIVKKRQSGHKKRTQGSQTHSETNNRSATRNKEKHSQTLKTTVTRPRPAKRYQSQTRGHSNKRNPDQKPRGKFLTANERAQYLLSAGYFGGGSNGVPTDRFQASRGDDSLNLLKKGQRRKMRSQCGGRSGKNVDSRSWVGSEEPLSSNSKSLLRLKEKMKQKKEIYKLNNFLKKIRPIGDDKKTKTQKVQNKAKKRVARKNPGDTQKQKKTGLKGMLDLGQLGVLKEVSGIAVDLGGMSERTMQRSRAQNLKRSLRGPPGRLAKQTGRHNLNFKRGDLVLPNSKPHPEKRRFEQIRDLQHFRTQQEKGEAGLVEGKPEHNSSQSHLKLKERMRAQPEGCWLAKDYQQSDEMGNVDLGQIHKCDVLGVEKREHEIGVIDDYYICGENSNRNSSQKKANKPNILQRRLDALKNEHRILENISKHSNFSRGELRDSLCKRSFQKRPNATPTEEKTSAQIQKNLIFQKSVQKEYHTGISELTGIEANRSITPQNSKSRDPRNLVAPNLAETEVKLRNANTNSPGNILPEQGKAVVVDSIGPSKSIEGQMDFVHSLSFKNFHGHDKTASSHFKRSQDGSQNLNWGEEGSAVGRGSLDPQLPQNGRHTLPRPTRELASNRTTLDVNLRMRGLVASKEIEQAERHLAYTYNNNNNASHNNTYNNTQNNNDTHNNNNKNHNNQPSHNTNHNNHNKRLSGRETSPRSIGTSPIYKGQKENIIANLGKPESNRSSLSRRQTITNPKRQPESHNKKYFQHEFPKKEITQNQPKPSKKKHKIEFCVTRSKTGSGAKSPKRSMTLKEKFGGKNLNSQTKQQGFTAEEVSSLMQLKFLKKKNGVSKTKFF